MRANTLIFRGGQNTFKDLCTINHRLRINQLIIQLIVAFVITLNFCFLFDDSGLHFPLDFPQNVSDAECKMMMNESFWILVNIVFDVFRLFDVCLKQVTSVFNIWQKQHS